MKKLMTILAVLVMSCGTAKADSAFDNWNINRTQSGNSGNSSKPQIKQKTVRQTIKEVPVVGDAVKAVETIVKGVERGIASFYWQPQPIACGKGRFNPYAMTAAHKTLPCGTLVKVTNVKNNKSVIVTINDRGPYIKGRIIDLSKAAAIEIDMVNAGVVPVVVERF